MMSRLVSGVNRGVREQLRSAGEFKQSKAPPTQQHPPTHTPRPRVPVWLQLVAEPGQQPRRRHVLLRGGQLQPRGGVEGGVEVAQGACGG